MSHQAGCPDVFNENGVLKTFTKCTGKHLYWNLFSDKVPGWNSASFFKKRLQRRCFPVNFEKLRITISLIIWELLFSWCHVRQKRLSHVIEQLHHELCFLQKSRLYQQVKIISLSLLHRFYEGLCLTFKNNTKTSKQECFLVLLRLIIT